MLGKSTLIQGILDNVGYHQIIHYQTPKALQVHLETFREVRTVEPRTKALYQYQLESFTTMFNMLSGPGRFIMDRAHLGEDVYSKRYRKYDGSYVFDLERNFIYDQGSDLRNNTALILLTTSDFSFIGDDGESHDVVQREEEQMDFFQAYNKTNLTKKIIIDVNDGTGKFKAPEVILGEVLTFLNE